MDKIAAVRVSPALEDEGPIDAHIASTVVAETYHSLIQPRRTEGRLEVVKRCRKQDDPHTASRFRKEVEALTIVGDHASDNNHVTQLLGTDITKLTITLRTEPGQSLEKYVDEHMISTLASDDSNIIWRQISGALAFVHARSIVHDDVKPDNIMWDPATQHSVLIDFGAALNYRELPADYFNLSGTPPYAPPEYLERKKGSAGDVWALGVTLLFAFRYVNLPDGAWILPLVFEQLVVCDEMKRWLSEVEGWRKAVAVGERSLLADMLEQNPQRRISALELEMKLSECAWNCGFGQS